jgi:hypothetical protein
MVETVHVTSPPKTEEVAAAVAELREALAEQITAHPQEDFGDDALHRFLVARNMIVADAVAMVLPALEWRQLRRPAEVRAADIEGEALTGKCYNPGFDRHGRPVLVIDATKENTWDVDQNMRHLAWQMERCIRQMKVRETRPCVCARATRAQRRSVG